MITLHDSQKTQQNPKELERSARVRHDWGRCSSQSQPHSERHSFAITSWSTWRTRALRAVPAWLSRDLTEVLRHAANSDASQRKSPIRNKWFVIYSSERPGVFRAVRAVRVRRRKLLDFESICVGGTRSVAVARPGSAPVQFFTCTRRSGAGLRRRSIPGSGALLAFSTSSSTVWLAAAEDDVRPFPKLPLGSWRAAAGISARARGGGHAPPRVAGPSAHGVVAFSRLAPPSPPN